jgi:hypothetical protein
LTQALQCSANQPCVTLQLQGTDAKAGSNGTAAAAKPADSKNTTAAAPAGDKNASAAAAPANGTDANKTAAAEGNATAGSNTTKAAQPTGPVSTDTKVWTPKPDGSVIGVANASGITSSNETDLAWDLRAEAAKYKMEMVSKHKGATVKEVRKDMPGSANKTKACLPCINVCKEEGLWMDADWCLDLLTKKDASTSYCKCYRIVQEAKKSAAFVGTSLGFSPMLLLVAAVQLAVNGFAAW